MRPGLAEFLEAHSMQGLPAYIVSAAAVLAATALRVALNPVLGDAAPYVFQAIVLLAIAIFAGHGPSLFGLALALVLGAVLIPPYEQSLTQKIVNEVSTTVAGVMIVMVTSMMRSALITAAAARREADFLSREMHHRIKNLFAVVGSMMTLSAREDPRAHATLTDLRTRLQALANAHDIVIEAFDFVNLAELVGRLMAPHVRKVGDEDRIRISGAPLCLPPSFMTPLTLIINEFATNAVKYGALAGRPGSVRLTWDRRDGVLEILWQETGGRSGIAASELGSAGFGSLLVEASVAQLRGTMDRNLTDDGLVVRLTFPCEKLGKNQFRSGSAAARQDECNPQQSSLSVLRRSKRFFRRRPEIRDSRS